MNHGFAGSASTAHSTFPMCARRTDFPMVGTAATLRTILIVPLRLQGELIGGLFARCIEVRPFTPAQIKLVETFAEQAVIAIENVRLFNELKESLEQQTATSEILGVIASSPTDIQPVLDVWPKMLRAFVMQPMPTFIASRTAAIGSWPRTEPWLLLNATSLGPSSAVYLQAGLLLTARSYTLLMF